MSDIPKEVWVNVHTLQTFRGRPPKNKNGLWMKFIRPSQIPMPRGNVGLDQIRLNEDQDKMMVEMIKDIQAAPNTLKQTVRWQKWFKAVWQAGMRAVPRETCYVPEEYVFDNTDDAFKKCPEQAVSCLEVIKHE